MKNSKNFPFNNARHLTKAEVSAGKKAIEQKTGKKRAVRGRPHKSVLEKFVPISIRLHPKIIHWAKAQAKKRGVGYQSIINSFLLTKISLP